MPSPNPTVRRQHSGNALTTTLSAPIVSAADASFTISAFTGWPDGSVGNFVVTVNAGQGDVEKILCSTRSGTTVNVVTRGYDSTTAAGHAAGATVAHTISAAEIDEANQHTAATTGVHGVAGAVVGTTDSQTLTNKTLGGFTATNPSSGTSVLTTVTGSNNGVIIQPGAASSLGLIVQGLASQASALIRTKLGATQTGRFIECLDTGNGTLFAVEADGSLSGTSPLVADRTAWTSFTPTMSAGWTLNSAAYKLIGKSFYFRITASYNGGSAATFNAWATVLGQTSIGYAQAVAAASASGGSLTASAVVPASSAQINLQMSAAITLLSVTVTGVIEVA